MSDTEEIVLCYVGLGSNMGDSKAHLMNALHALDRHSATQFLNTSSIYQSKPHGPQNQLDYLNAAVSFETILGAEELLDVLQEIENQNGRVRKDVERWGARTLDLDLLLYGNKTINSKRLIVPHPRICERAFVLYPIRDLLEDTEEDLKINKSTTLQDCINNLPATEINNIKSLGYV